MSVADWFSEFCSNIQVRDSESISRRYSAVTRCLNTDFWGAASDTAHSLYVGSYGRNTAVHGFTDLDMIFQLPYFLYEKYDKYYGNGHSALLDTVCSSIKQTYPATDIGASGDVILVPFDDGITFEVVPAFITKDGTCTYPDSSGDGSWKVTNPRPEIKAIRDRNARCNHNLVPLCRMMKAWKNTWGLPMGGLLVDTLAYEFIIGWEYKDKSCLYYDFMCRDFLKYLADQDEKQTYWKAPGSGQYLYDEGLFKYKAQRCYHISLDAIRLKTDNKESSAKRKWRLIFGATFPA